MSDKQPFDRPMVYRIRIKGHLDQYWSDWLEGVAINPQADGETMLCGLVSDQCALYGLLKKVHDMGLGLISVRRIECDADKAVPKPDQKRGAASSSVRRTTQVTKQQNPDKEVK
jgi:hypothetical protein